MPEIPGNDIDEDCDGTALLLTQALAPVPSTAVPSRFFFDKKSTALSQVWNPDNGPPSELDVPETLITEDEAGVTLTRPLLSGSMFFTAPELRVGITWTDPSVDDRYEMPIETNNRIGEALEGKMKLTLEAVVQTPGTASASGGSAIMYFGTSGDWGELDLRFNAPDELVFYWKGQVAASWNPTLFQRSTLHLVVDTSQPTAADRVLLYRNGKLVPPSTPASTVPGLNELVSFTAGSSFVLGNRSNGARAFAGTIYHIGIYGSVLREADVRFNHNVLRTAEGIQVVVE